MENAKNCPKCHATLTLFQEENSNEYLCCACGYRGRQGNRYIIRGDHPTFKRIDTRCDSIFQVIDNMIDILSLGYQFTVENVSEGGYKEHCPFCKIDLSSDTIASYCGKCGKKK